MYMPECYLAFYMLYENDKDRYKMKQCFDFIPICVSGDLTETTKHLWILYFALNVEAVLDDLFRKENAIDLHTENVRGMLSRLFFEILNHDTTENCVFILTHVSCS